MDQDTFITLGEFIIEKQKDFKYSSGELSRLLSSIKLAAKMVNREVNKAGISHILGKTGHTNIQGEKQQKLDVLANEIFIESLSQREVVCGIASEEEENFIEIKNGKNSHLNKYVVLIDPLDGSSNIDVNVSVGTIFSVYGRLSEIGSPGRKKIFCSLVRNKWLPGISFMALPPCWYLLQEMESMDLRWTLHWEPSICPILTLRFLIWNKFIL